MKSPQASKITIVILPRERVHCTPECVRRVYELTDFPFELLVVACGFPDQLQMELSELSVSLGFKILKIPQFILPSHARNLALKQIDTPWVVFLDNDIGVEKGWLGALMAGALASKADVVAPLVMERYPGVHRLHCALGEIVVTDEGSRRILSTRSIPYQVTLRQFRRLKLERQITPLVELHCILASVSVLKDISGFDESILNTREQVDFCLTLAKHGKKIVFEPGARVTFLYPIPLDPRDEPYFDFRWDLKKYAQTVSHFNSKWNVSVSDQHERYFQNRRIWIKKYRNWPSLVALYSHAQFDKIKPYLKVVKRKFLKSQPVAQR